MMMVDDDYNNNNGDDGGLTMDGYYYDIADESGNTDDTDTELLGIFILIKVLELWLGISVIFFIIATLRFYVALYQLGMRTNGFQRTLQQFRHYVLLQWLHGKRLLYYPKTFTLKD